MNRLSIGFGCLLIFFNLFVFHNSYAMTSEKCGYHTIFGDEIWADFLDKFIQKFSCFGANQTKEDDDNEKRSLANSENRKIFFTELIEKFFPVKKKSILEVNTEMVNFASCSPSSFIEKLNTEK